MNNLKFIDLFAGIGGFHLALKSLGMKCVFTSKIDNFARKLIRQILKDNYFKNLNLFAGDIWNVDFKKIPNFDILCAGFPCQPFSQWPQKKDLKIIKMEIYFFQFQKS